MIVITKQNLKPEFVLRIFFKKKIVELDKGF
jgi:hypothetical protein